MGGPDGHKNKEVNYQKSYFDVLGLCCSAEAVLIEKILKPLEGIQKVSVVVPSKTVIVVHDSLLISQLQIVKALNEAQLEATIRVYGAHKIVKKWPSPYIMACGLLLAISLLKKFFHPLKWLAIAAAVVGLPPIVLRSIAAIRRYTLDINILMLIAVGGAIALKDYTEAGSIIFLFTIAEWLESMAGHKAAAGMSLLMSGAPQKAVLANTGQVVDVQDVQINTVIAVKAGEMVPIDGIVLEGRSEVDESSLTGESFPVTKQPESLVWAGTLNIDGYLSVRTTALANDSAVAKMARLVEEAQNGRSRTQRLIDSCTKYYTPAVVVTAAGVALVPLAMRVSHPKWWFRLALVLLVSACPCALVLSTPVSTFCGLLKAARTGLLIKGGDILEALASVKVVAFDKTGTITKGEFSVIHFQPLSNKVTMHTLLHWVSSVESKSSHPMASSLVDYAKLNGIEPKPEDVKEFIVYPGEGISGEINGKTIYIGNKRIATRASCKTVPNMGIEGVTYGYIFSDMEPVGIFALSDSCRIGASQALKELKSLGIKVVMLTGDSIESAKHAQNQLGQAIDIHAELLPEDKVRLVGELKAKEGYTAMVGDGINDAPALAIANVGISMGLSGSAIAMETSHITLMSNDISRIPKAVMLARKTHRKIISNIFFSVVTKVVVLALACFGHPLLWAAVLADVGTCLLVILNSMMLLQTKTTKEKNCCSSSRQENTCCGSSSKEKKCCSFASEKKCCSSSNKPHLERPKNFDHYDAGRCHLSGPCRKSNSWLDSNKLHDQNTSQESEAQGRSCRQYVHLQLPNHHLYCQEKIKHASIGAKEHIISKVNKEEHHCNLVHSEKIVECGSCKLETTEDCCKRKATYESSSIQSDTDKQTNKECCISNRNVSHCSSSQTEDCCKSKAKYESSSIDSDTDKQTNKECCISNRNASHCSSSQTEDYCKSKATYESSSIHSDTGKQINKGCCISNRIETHCSSSQIVAERSINGCCRHHMHGYGRTGGCHESGVIKLPEIVIE